MLKVLVVDDDKLTRKGLIVAMPWAEHSMEVIGEAANGIEALEFLKTHQVDLVLTDLEMPLMSGMEFIRNAIELYPQLYFVILTIHSDFEYIQEALRLGAIDYIAKVQLDRENFSTLLVRIQERISKSAREKSLAEANWENRTCHSETVYALLSLEDDLDAGTLLEELRYPFINTGNGVWLCFDVGEEIVSNFSGVLEGDWIFLKITGCLGMKYSNLYDLVTKYKKSALFYEYDPAKRLAEYSSAQLKQEEQPVSKEQFQQLKKCWLSMNWVRDPKVFDKIRLDLKQSRLTTAQLLHIVVAIENGWNHSYSDTANQTVNAPPCFHSWKEIESWLYEVYQKTVSFQDQLRFSPEVTDGIFQAKKILESEFDTCLHSSDVASRVNMSRSYFSQCFHDIVGDSFSNYLRKVRIDKAKEYLSRTNYSIQWIAEKTGYYDEKYFSRIFKKTTNMLPSEYRRNFRD